MAQTDQISPEALESITRQIAEAIRLPAEEETFTDASTATPEVTRTLTVWGIKPEAMAALMEGADPEQLSDWAVPASRWHHQMKFNTETNAFARSIASPTNAAEVELRQMSISARAEKIAHAIEWVEQELQKNPARYGLPSPYDPLIRLLDIPSRRVTALMLLDELHHGTHIVLVAARRGDNRLSEPRPLSEGEFLRFLAAQPTPVGIG